MAEEPKKIVEAAILFGDIVNCVEVSNNASLENYDDFICQFQEVAVNAFHQYLIFDKRNRRYQLHKNFFYTLKGDELFLILLTTPAADLKTLLTMALHLKIKWLLSPFNRTRVDIGQTPKDVGIGINFGKIIMGWHPGNKEFPTPEGFQINLAKRIESESRRGSHSKIYLSHSAYRVCRRAHFRIDFEPKETILKGFEGLTYLYELKHISQIALGVTIRYPVIDEAELGYLESIIDLTPHDLWLRLLVAEKLLSGGTAAQIDRAYHYIEELLDLEPKLADGLFLLGKIYESRGNLPEAVEQYDRVLALLPDFDAARLSLIGCLLKLQRPEEALTRLLAYKNPADYPLDYLEIEYKELYAQVYAQLQNREQTLTYLSSLAEDPLLRLVHFDFQPFKFLQDDPTYQELEQTICQRLEEGDFSWLGD
ncbi:MAG: tetratricopeptide repeat protein [Desulfobacteraceae bacterium]